MKHIVVIDDDPGICDAIGLMFKESSYSITVCHTGEALLSGQLAVPDLVILDKQLSGMDGLEVCRLFKSQASTRNIPVILISATPGIQRIARRAMANDALEKPFKIKDLREMVERLLD